MLSQHLREDSRDIGRHFTKAPVDSQPAADEALVEELQAVRGSIVLGLGPGRPFAAESFVIAIPPALREEFLVAIQESVEPALCCFLCSGIGA